MRDSHEAALSKPWRVVVLESACSRNHMAEPTRTPGGCGSLGGAGRSRGTQRLAVKDPYSTMLGTKLYPHLRETYPTSTLVPEK